MLPALFKPSKITGIENLVNFGESNAGKGLECPLALKMVTNLYHQMG